MKGKWGRSRRGSRYARDCGSVVHRPSGSTVRPTRHQQPSRAPVPPFVASMSSIQSPIPDPVATPAARGSLLRRCSVAGMRSVAIGLLSLVCVASALWLVLQWGILPRIESWRPALERRASAALGLPVQIGALRAVDSGIGWAGALEMEQVVVLDPRTRQEALRLPRVRATLSATSLLPGWDGVWRLRMRQLLIDAPELDVRRDASGVISIAGLDVGRGGGASGEALADWFFSQSEFAIRGGRIQWTDGQRELAPLNLREVDLVVRNSARRHALRLDATPPSDWGERFSLRGDFTQPLLTTDDAARGLLARPGDWQRWRGTAYAELPVVDLAPLQHHVQLPLELTSGRGALRVWADLHGPHVESATADVHLHTLRLRLAPTIPPLALTKLDGRIALARTPSTRTRDAGWSLALQQLAFTEAHAGEEHPALDWPAGDLRVDWRLGRDGRLSGGAFSTPRLDLAPLATALSRLPSEWVGSRLQAEVAELAPRGVLSAFELTWDGPPDVPLRYRASGKAQGLALAAGPAPAAPPDGEPTPGRPGINGLDIVFRTDEAGGEATLSLRDGSLEFPGLFAVPRIALTQLDTRLQWRIEADPAGSGSRIDARLRDLHLANADLEGRFDAQWRGSTAASADSPGTLDLSGRLTRADAIRVPRYLPLVVDHSVRDYFERALQGGRAFGVTVRVRGDLADFPFRSPTQGEFRVAAQLDDVRLAYVPAEPGWAGDPADVERRPWPAFADVRGELVFDREAMQLRHLSATLPDVGSGALMLRDISGDIADLDVDIPRLKIQGHVRGPLDDALQYLNATPVGGWIGDALAQASARGGAQAPFDLQLGLDIPLDDSHDTRVQGALQLAGNDLRLTPTTPLLTGTRARIAFSESAFSLTQGRARVLGGDAQFDGALQADGALRFNVQGLLTADGLKRLSGAGPLARATTTLTGQTHYQLALGFVGDQIDWQFRSDLAGLAIALPPPLGKRADQALPLRAQAVPQATAAGALPRDLLRIELGSDDTRVLQAHYLRELPPDGARVLRGAVALGRTGPLVMPQQGVSAQVQLPDLDLTAWDRTADALASSGGMSADSPYAPSTVTLQAQQLHASGYTLHRVNATLTRGLGTAATLWRAEIDAAELAGHAEYRAPGAHAASSGRVVARLARLALPKGGDDAVSELLDQAPASSVPALDIVVDDFELRGKKLGRLEIEAENRPADGSSSGAGDWELKRLRLSTPEAVLDASGRWLAAPHPGISRRTALDFKLDVSNGGALLTRLGEAEVLRGAKGQIAGKLDWLGSPFDIDYASLGGRMRVDFGRGQFLQAEPGLFKLLGVLSLQSLPRRLLLDFRDVFSSGFAFDALTGDVLLRQGVALTDNLRLRGVQAVVLMEGSADVEHETQNLRVAVVPEINAGAASLAYAAINPAIGLGSFLAQLFLRRPLAEAGTREFRVTGPWSAPQVERVERSNAAREPAAPASAPITEAPQ